ncbi:MAG: DegV family protein [Anaerolineales bacterium]
MSKVAIVTDSVASLPEDIIRELDIHWVPYYIHRGKEVWRDLVSIDRTSFYQWMANASEIPKTANPSPADYANIYQEIAASGLREIVSIHITSKGSGAFQAACIARDMILERLPELKIEVIDSLNVSMCQGWMVIEAARAALAGASFEAVIAKVKSMIPISQMLQTADTLKYLYLGGRIGKAQHLMGSLLNIKPIISMREGVIVSLGQARSRRRVYQLMVDKIEATVSSKGRIKIAYVHAAAREEVEKLKELVEARLDVVESLMAELSPALGVHTGPGTAGVCYFPVLD